MSTARAAWADPGRWSHKTGPGRGLILLPSLAAPEVSFEILAADAASITVSGNIAAIPAYAGQVASGDAFAILYGQYVKEEMENPADHSLKPVKLFDREGTNGFADDGGDPAADPSPDGVCQVCHTATDHWRANAMLADHFSGRTCTDCHDHATGFAPSCLACHGYPPVTDAPGSPDGLVDIPSPTGSASAGAHRIHVDQATGYGFACDNCHSGGMPASPVYDDSRIQIGFATFGRAGENTIFHGQTAVSPAVTGYDYRPPTAPRWSRTMP
ncbi:MAG: hypothetical protein AB1634_01680 [Thermodesulfobacteriota bacterium]